MDTTTTTTTTDTVVSVSSSSSGKTSPKATISPYFRRDSVGGRDDDGEDHDDDGPSPTSTTTSSSSIIISPEKITSSNSTSISSVTGGTTSSTTTSSRNSNSNSYSYSTGTSITSKYFRGGSSTTINRSNAGRKRSQYFVSSSPPPPSPPSSSSSSSASVHGCVQSLGPVIFTWTSTSTNRRMMRRTRGETIWTDHNTSNSNGNSNSNSNNSEGICQRCQEIIKDARRQFDACPLFRHHMDILLSKSKERARRPSSSNDGQKERRRCCCTVQQDGQATTTTTTQGTFDTSSCAARIGLEMMNHPSLLRHLCHHQCYLRSFAPVRDWTIMRKALYRQLQNYAASSTDDRESDTIRDSANDSDEDDDSDSCSDNDSDSDLDGDDYDRIIKARTSNTIDQLLDGWKCRLVHPDDDSDDSGDDGDDNRSTQKRRTKKRRKIKDVGTANAPRTEFISPIGTRYQSAAFVVRHIIMTTIRPPEYEPTKDRQQSQAEERKRRKIGFVGRLSHSKAPSLSCSPSLLPLQIIKKNDEDSSCRNETQISSYPSSSLFLSGSSVRSPLGLLEELFPDDPWRLLLCTIFLNRTQRKQVDSLLCQFLDRWSDAESVVNQSLDETTTAQLEEQIATLLLPMGLRHKRSRGIIRFCHDYLALIREKNQQHSTSKIKQERRGSDHQDVRPPTADDFDANNNSSHLLPEFTLTRKEVKKLFFCGDYAADAYSMFILSDFSAGVKSNDHALVAYSEYQQTNKRLLLAKSET